MPQRISYKNFRPASKHASAAGKGASKRSDTLPELRLRRELWKNGLRYRKNFNELPGKPDIVFKKAKVIIFCDGDFWHGKDWDKKRNQLKKGSNSEYWVAKIERNMERDIEHNSVLENDGWTVLRFWESEIRNNLDTVINTIIQTLDYKHKGGAGTLPRNRCWGGERAR